MGNITDFPNLLHHKNRYRVNLFYGSSPQAGGLLSQRIGVQKEGNLCFAGLCRTFPINPTLFLQLGGQKRFQMKLIITSLSLLAGATAFAIDVTTPAIPASADFFGIEIGAIQLTISLYLLGYGLGQIPMGLLADHFGRRVTVLTAMSLFVVFAIIASVSSNPEILLLMRLLQGFCGASGPVISRAMARDLTEGADTGRLLGLMTAGLGGVMIVAPLVGALLLDFYGWRAPFFASGVFAAVAVLMIWANVGETNLERPESRISERFITGLKAFAGSKQGLLGALYIGLAFCSLIAFVTLSSELFIRQYGTSEIGYAIIFSAASVGYAMGGLACRRLIRQHSSLRLTHSAAGIFGFVALAMLITLVSGTDSYGAMIAVMVISFLGVGAMLTAGSTLALESLPKTAGMTAGIIGSFQILLGGVFSAILSMVNFPAILLLQITVIILGLFMILIIIPTRNLQGSTTI